MPIRRCWSLALAAVLLVLGASPAHAKSFSLPEARLGRWLTMDAGDWDGDGTTDLLLGNFAEGPATIRSATDWKKGPPFLLLRNRMHNK